MALKYLNNAVKLCHKQLDAHYSDTLQMRCSHYDVHQ